MKTPNVSIKDVLGKLSFLKNNLGLLVPIFIAVVAVLLFIPTRILRGKLQNTIQQQSLQPGNEIRSLSAQVREAARAAAMEQYISAYAKDANEIELQMKHTTERELLSYELFPDTNETSALLFERFAQKYMASIDAMLKSLDAATPPTDNEIDAALASAPRSPLGMRGAPGAYDGGYGAYGGMPSPMTPQMGSTPGSGQRRAFRVMTEMDRKIVEKICVDKARGAKVYAGPVELEGYTYWSDWKFEDRDKAYRDCWYWQVGYWILEDVVTTIRETNKNSDSILTSPVKRLMNANFTLQRSRASGGGRGRRVIRKDAKVSPSYVTKAKDAMTIPCTGRYSSDQIDVVHFNVRVVVGADDVMPFMQELCSAKEHKFRGFYGDLPEQTYKHNQITILESSVAPVNKDTYEHNLYRYGDDAVVELDLICEYIFNVAAYDKIQPKLVKEDIDAAMNATTNKK
jgi:hypothetical protein